MTTTDLDQYRARFLQDLLTESTAACWERRAAVFDQAMPRPGDFTGRATPAEVADMAERIRARATACRQKAAALRMGNESGVAPVVWEALAEVGLYG